MGIQKGEIGGVILAGGKGSRMEFRDKGLQLLHGKPLVSHVIRRAAPQVEHLVLSVNHHRELYHPFSLPLVPDLDGSYRGPLLGILAAMQWFQSAERVSSKIQYLACFAADVPEFPGDIVQQLAEALSDASSDAAYIVHRGQIQPLFSLWRLNQLSVLRDAIEKGFHGPKPLLQAIDAIAVSEDSTTPGAFFNVNELSDLAAAEALISGEFP